LRKQGRGRQNVAEEKPAKAHIAPTGFFWSLAALAAYCYRLLYDEEAGTAALSFNAAFRQTFSIY
jgi:hypothetical protein